MEDFRGYFSHLFVVCCFYLHAKWNFMFLLSKWGKITEEILDLCIFLISVINNNVLVSYLRLGAIRTPFYHRNRFK